MKIPTLKGWENIKFPANGLVRTIKNGKTNTLNKVG